MLQIGGRDLAWRTNIYCWETRPGTVLSAVQLGNSLVLGRLSGTSLSINIDDLFLIENNWILSVSQAENLSYAWRARGGAAVVRVTQPRHFPRWAARTTGEHRCSVPQAEHTGSPRMLRRVELGGDCVIWEQPSWTECKEDKPLSF